MRAATSVLPPAAKGTITVTGLVGQFCACAGAAIIAAATARHAAAYVGNVFIRILPKFIVELVYWDKLSGNCRRPKAG